jgi:hypothetical protein
MTLAAYKIWGDAGSIRNARKRARRSGDPGSRIMPPLQASRNSHKTGCEALAACRNRA